MLLCCWKRSRIYPVLYTVYSEEHSFEAKLTSGDWVFRRWHLPWEHDERR